MDEPVGTYFAMICINSGRFTHVSSIVGKDEQLTNSQPYIE